MKLYIKLNDNNIIVDAITYNNGIYTEIEVDSIPQGINGGWFKYENNTIIEIPELKVVEKDENNYITKLDFLGRFTPSEYRAIRNMEETDDILFQYSDLLRYLNEKIDLTDERIIFGVNYLISKGIISSERANVILK